MSLSYGERIARQKAKQKQQKQNEEAEATSQKRTRKATSKKPIKLDFYPLESRDASDAPRGYDWFGESIDEISGYIVDQLAGKHGASTSVLLRAPAGTGKTSMTTRSLARVQSDLGKELPFIVLSTPKHVSQGGWQRTIQAWNLDNPDNTLNPLLITTFDKFANILDDNVAYTQVMRKLGKNGVIVIDEAHGYKNPTSKRSKKMQKLSHARKIMLTATPMGNNVPLDTGSYLILGGYYKNKTRYMNETNLASKLGYHNELLVYDAEGRISTAIWPEYETVSNQRAELFYVPNVSAFIEDMPDTTSQIIRLPHSEQLDSDVSSLHAAYLKRMFDTAGEYRLALTERINQDDSRIDALLELVNKHTGEQPLIFYWHVSIRDAIAETFQKNGIEFQEISGSSSIDNVDDTDVSKPILVQYQAGSESIEFKRSRATIFFENQGSYILLVQSRGRNVRRGMSHPVTHYYLLSDQPYEEELFDRVQKHEELSEEILDDLAVELAGSR